MSERVDDRPGRLQRKGRLAVTCPCCATDLTIDRKTGTVLAHCEPERAVAGGKSFDALLANVDSTKKRAAALFDREISTLRDQERVLDAKFEEALRRAEETDDDEPLVRPWDLD